MPDDSTTVQDAANRFLTTVSQDLRPKYQQEINRFVRWYGGDRIVAQMRGHDVALYADTLGGNVSDAAERIEIVRGFLAHAKKSGLTAKNMAVHLRPPKAASSASNGRPQPVREEIHLTAEGIAALEEELVRLRTALVQNAKDLKRAMADKDFRENAPLDAAREQKAFLESRVREVEATLADSVLLDGSRRAGAMVQVGSSFVLKNMISGHELRYTVVSPSEANPRLGKISVASPVGRAVLERRAGEEVDVEAPAGIVRFRIESVES